MNQDKLAQVLQQIVPERYDHRYTCLNTSWHSETASRVRLLKDNRLVGDIVGWTLAVFDPKFIGDGIFAQRRVCGILECSMDELWSLMKELKCNYQKNNPKSGEKQSSD